MNNPFNFRHITELKTHGGLDDIGPCVVLATPSMLQVLSPLRSHSVWAFVSNSSCPSILAITASDAVVTSPGGWLSKHCIFWHATEALLHVGNFATLLEQRL